MYVRRYVRRRHVLTKAERKEGVLKSLESRKTPPQLKRGLRKWAKKVGWLPKDMTTS